MVKGRMLGGGCSSDTIAIFETEHASKNGWELTLQINILNTGVNNASLGFIQPFSFLLQIVT